MRALFSFVLVCWCAFFSGAFYPYPTPRALTGASATGAPFVIFAGNYSNAVASSDGGATWITSTAGVGYPEQYAVWGNNQFVAVGTTTSNSLTSPDGIHWTSHSPSVFSGLSQGPMTWDGTRYYSVLGSRVFESTDGITWSSVTLPGSYGADIAYNGSVVCIINGLPVSFSGTTSNLVESSSNGTTWTTHTLPSTQAWTNIVWNGSYFLATVNGSTVAATSPDCTTWTSRTLPVNAYRPTGGGGVFLLQPGSGTTVYTSPDGNAWTSRTTPFSSYGAAWNGSKFLIVGGSGLPDLSSATSTNGVSWTSVTLPSGAATGWLNAYSVR